MSEVPHVGLRCGAPFGDVEGREALVVRNPGKAILLSSAGNEFYYKNAFILLVRGIFVVKFARSECKKIYFPGWVWGTIRPKTFASLNSRLESNKEEEEEAAVVSSGCRA